jgi:hypothetical protein
VNIPLPSGIVPSSSEIGDVSLDLNAAGVTLKPDTKYRYSIEATNTAGTAQGQSQFFTTPSGTSSPPSVESESASDITSRRTTLEAQVNPGGAQTTYEFWLEYANCQSSPPGSAACMSISVEKVGEGTITAAGSGQRISATVTHLQPGYSYTYWVIAANSVGKTEGTHQSFTAAPAPVIAGESVSGVTGANAKLEAQINPEGQNVRYQFQLVNDPSEYASELVCPEPSATICIGTHVQGALPIGLVWDNLENPLAAQPVSLDLESTGAKLKPGTTYHYRVIAVPSVPSEDTIEWEGPPVYGPDQTFTTAPAPLIAGEDVFQPLSSQTLPANSGSSSQTSGGSLGRAPGSAIPQAVADLARGRHHLKRKHHHRSKVARHRRHRAKVAGRRHL